jgi:hypothetical protein
VHSSAEKNIQPVKPGWAWFHGLWEKMVHVSLDVGRKHHKNANMNKLEDYMKKCAKN